MMFDFLSQQFSSVFSRLTGKSHLTEQNVQEALDKVKEALLEADVPYACVDSFLQEVYQEAVGQKVLKSLKPGEQFIKVVHEKLIHFLGGKGASTPFSFQIPSIIMVMGLQGSGKTTTIAKLAYYMQEQAKQRGKKRSILTASVDYYRPAAIDQLEVLAKQVGISFYRSSYTEPLNAVRDIVRYYKQNNFELLLLDTAGRLHVDSSMLEELRELDVLLTPKYKLLVLDAMTGQESLKIATAFDQAIGFTGALLTKMDSQTRAGAAFAFRYMLNKPLLFVGTGEKITDLETFYPERIAKRILGMGDLTTLLEKAATAGKEEQARTAQAFMWGTMTLEDFAQQLQMINKLGSLASIARYLPGGAFKLSEEQIEQGERELKKFKAIISSMTKKERIYPKILTSSRKQRIAKGAGVQISDINLLVSRFEQMRQFAKLFKKFNR
jgi:signal recognition particle subunit SRP54